MNRRKCMACGSSRFLFNEIFTGTGSGLKDEDQLNCLCYDCEHPLYEILSEWWKKGGPKNYLDQKTFLAKIAKQFIKENPGQGLNELNKFLLWWIRTGR